MQLAKASFLLLLLLPSAFALDVGASANGVPQDDETALIQHGIHIRHRTHKFLARSQVPHTRPPSVSLVNTLKDMGRFDCEAYPSLCKSPFDCHEVRSADVDLWSKEGAAWQGAPNYKLWCALPHYEAFVSRCAAGDVDGAGKLQFQLTAAGHFGAVTKEMDASFCFIEGHCANSQVSNETSAEEAADMCDDRLGREAWATWGSEATPAEDQLNYNTPEDLSNGYKSQEQTRPMLLASCAMGIYHCDVRYCRQTYCKEEYYVKKYGHLLKEFGWGSE